MILIGQVSILAWEQLKLVSAFTDPSSSPCKDLVPRLVLMIIHLLWMQFYLGMTKG